MFVLRQVVRQPFRNGVGQLSHQHSSQLSTGPKMCNQSQSFLLKINEQRLNNHILTVQHVNPMNLPENVGSSWLDFEASSVIKKRRKKMKKHKLRKRRKLERKGNK